MTEFNLHFITVPSATSQNLSCQALLHKIWSRINMVCRVHGTHTVFDKRPALSSEVPRSIQKSLEALSVQRFLNVTCHTQ